MIGYKNIIFKFYFGKLNINLILKFIFNITRTLYKINWNKISNPNSNSLNVKGLNLE